MKKTIFPVPQAFLIFVVQIHFHNHCHLVFHKSQMWSQDIRQAHNHVFVHQHHALQLASAMWVWNCEQLMCQLLVMSIVLFFRACLWSAACKQNSGTSSCRASLCALSTMLRAMFSQYMPTTWPCLKKSISSSFLQFSILRVRSCRNPDSALLKRFNKKRSFQ